MRIAWSLVAIFGIGACSTRTMPTDGAACTPCAGFCVDVSSDEQNCGYCDVACTEQEICRNGKCVCDPALGLLGHQTCGGRCIDTSADDNNCGACGCRCPSGYSCGNGKCKPGCQAPATLCGFISLPNCLQKVPTACVDLQSDNGNCGACDMKCDTSAGLSCVSGKCVCAFLGHTLCGSKCADLTVDPLNCGACGTACPSSQPGCGCMNGKCAGSCSAPMICCAPGSCVDVQTNNDNCGTCGTKCNTSDGQKCVAGACSHP